MAFWKNQFSDAYKDASRFAGKGGRIATLPDIIDARIDGPEMLKQSLKIAIGQLQLK